MSNSIFSNNDIPSFLPPELCKAGSSDSQEYPPTISGRPMTVKVFSVSLLNRFRNDRIRITPCPDNVGSIISKVVIAYGGHLYSPKSTNEALEFQLWGKAWSEVGSDAAAVFSRLLLMNIMKSLAFEGWNLALGAELAKDEKGKDILFFESAEKDPDASLFCINFPRLDRIKVIGASPELIKMMGDSILKTWPGGIQQGTQSFYGSFEFKLSGLPWAPHSKLGIKKCCTMTTLLEQFRMFGYKVYASLRIKKKEKEMPTLFFRKVTTVYK